MSQEQAFIPPERQIGFTLILGSILGFSGILLNVIFYQMGWIWEMWSPGVLMIVRFFLFLFLGLALIYVLKKKYPGFYPFRRVFANFLLIGFVATLYTNTYNYWFETQQEPDFSLRYLTRTKENMISHKAEYLKTQTNEIEYNKIIKNIEEGIHEVQNNPTTLWGVYMGGFKHGFFYSLITGLVITILLRDIHPKEVV